MSEYLHKYLKSNRHIAEAVLNADRMIIVYSMLRHKATFDLTFDNLLFLINRIEMMDPVLRSMEPESTKQMINAFLLS